MLTFVTNEERILTGHVIILMTVHVCSSVCVCGIVIVWTALARFYDPYHLTNGVSVPIWTYRSPCTEPPLMDRNSHDFIYRCTWALLFDDMFFVEQIGVIPSICVYGLRQTTSRLELNNSRDREYICAAHAAQTPCQHSADEHVVLVKWQCCCLQMRVH